MQMAHAFHSGEAERQNFRIVKTKICSFNLCAQGEVFHNDGLFGDYKLKGGIRKRNFVTKKGKSSFSR